MGRWSDEVWALHGKTDPVDPGDFFNRRGSRRFWAAAIRRGDEIRFIEGSLSDPPSLEALFTWLITRVDALEQAAPLAQLEVFIKTVLGREGLEDGAAVFATRRPDTPPDAASDHRTGRRGRLRRMEVVEGQIVWDCWLDRRRIGVCAPAVFATASTFIEMVWTQGESRPVTPDRESHAARGSDPVMAESGAHSSGNGRPTTWIGAVRRGNEVRVWEGKTVSSADVARLEAWTWDTVHRHAERARR